MEPKAQRIEIKHTLREEDIIFNNFITEFPLIEDLIESLSLVSNTTGEPFIKAPESQNKATGKPQESENIKLIAEAEKLNKYAQRLLNTERSYTKEEIIEEIIKDAKIDQERAIKGFNKLIENNIIELNEINETYYLTGSTPF